VRIEMAGAGIELHDFEIQHRRLTCTGAPQNGRLYCPADASTWMGETWGYLIFISAMQKSQNGRCGKSRPRGARQSRRAGRVSRMGIMRQALARMPVRASTLPSRRADRPPIWCMFGALPWSRYSAA
jgi:hypothetical protein